LAYIWILRATKLCVDDFAVVDANMRHFFHRNFEYKGNPLPGPTEIFSPVYEIQHMWFETDADLLTDFSARRL
jgi:hypothetical protein